jgi:putative two-component system response regulator
VVDDNEENVLLVEQMLRKSGYHTIHSTTDSREAVSRVESLKPDLLILDLLMPPPDGFEILDKLTLSPTRDKLMAILVLTGDVGPGTKVKALSMGAKEILNKPVEKVDLLMRVRTLLDWRFARKEALNERTRRVAAEQQGGSLDFEHELMERIAIIAGCLDPEGAKIGSRVADLAAQIGAELDLNDITSARLRSAARFFDMGVLALPEAVRQSRDSRNPEERRAMKRHTQIANDMFGGSSCAVLEMAKDIATAHHERWDGTGYPLGTKGPTTPLSARIVAVAMSYDSFVTNQRGHSALSRQQALAEVQRQAGYAFDPNVVTALVRFLDRMSSEEISSHGIAGAEGITQGVPRSVAESIC